MKHTLISRCSSIRNFCFFTLRVYITFSATIMLTSCATMIRGTTQLISINTEPTSAKVVLSNGQSCTTPCNVEVERKNTLQITISKNNCNTHTTAMVPTLAGAGAMLGGIIDYGTGAVYDLQPNPLFVTLVCGNTHSN